MSRPLVGLLARAGLGLSLLIALSLPRAWAHPFGQRYYSLRSEVRMGPEGPDLVLAGEVPIMVVLAEFRRYYSDVERPGADEDAAYLARKLEQLSRGASVGSGGQPVEGRWMPLDDPRNGKSAEGSFTYFLRFEPHQPWDLSAGRLELELQSEAYPDLPLWLASYAVVEPEMSSWRVNENSARALIGDAADDAEAMLQPEGWTQDQALRTLRLVFERQPEQAEEPSPTAPRAGGCWG
jgi:hypothetical protein